MITRWIVIFQIIFTLLIWSEHSYGQSPSNPEVATDSGAKPENEHAFAIPVRILEAPVDELTHKEDSEHKQQSQERHEENLSVQKEIAETSKNIAQWNSFQLVISAFSLLGLAIASTFAGLAWCESKAHTKEAASTAKAAWKQLEIAEDTRVKQLRPYLTLDEISYGAQRDGRIAVAIALINSGQTPAFIKQASWVIQSYLGDKPDAEVPDRVTDTNLVVGPRCHHSFAAILHLDQSLIAVFEHEIKSRQRTISVYFKVIYADVFGQEYLTEFSQADECLC